MSIPRRRQLQLCRVALLTTPLAVGAPILTPNQAQACGGTFCDNTGGVPMPVDQSGEDILFVQDGPEIEVHIRIQYTGQAEHFAWLVPIQAIPEVSVGSENLFLQLAVATAKRWTRASSYECEDEDPWGNDDGGGFVPDNDLTGAPSEPELVLAETVGAYEVVVLQGGTAAEVIEFLDQNGYAQDPEAEPILQEYLDEGFLFAAVKLTAGADVDAIHPLVFRFPGDEPCVPIRLTRIAAEQDMGVRAYFLGQERWAPQNYAHVVVNPLAYSWLAAPGGFGDGLYTQVLSLAVDEAGGRAFATDYAGSSSRVSTLGVYSASWDETVFVGLNMAEAIAALAQQELNTHPLIQPLLLEFMPPPADVDPLVYWNNIEQYIGRGDLNDWDSAGFAAALAERIIEPGLHAADLLDAWPYLTRLHTTMSPHEMIEDPMFQPAPDLGEVDNRLVAAHVDLCGEDGQLYSVPFEDEVLPVCLSDFYNQWPAQLRAHPALRVEQIPAMGPPQVLEDYREAILADHAAHQAEQSCAGEGGADDDQGDSGGAEGDEGGTGDASLSEGGSKASCVCRSEPRASGAPALGLLGLAFLLGGRLRRRRARSKSPA